MLSEEYIPDDGRTQYVVAEQVEEKLWTVLHAQVDDPVSNNYVYDIYGNILSLNSEF